MILDGYWKKELQCAIRTIKIWQRLSGLLRDYAQHQVSKAILYSAVIIRKMFEYEKGEELSIKKNNWPMLPLELLKYEIEVTEYPFSGDKDFIIERIIPENYNSSKAEMQKEALNTMCNQIIHSYIWSIYYSSSDLYRIAGVIFASDRAKEEKAYALRNEEWIKAIEYCLVNGNI